MCGDNAKDDEQKVRRGCGPNGEPLKYNRTGKFSKSPTAQLEALLKEQEGELAAAHPAVAFKPCPTADLVLSCARVQVLFHLLRASVCNLLRTRSR